MSGRRRAVAGELDATASGRLSPARLSHQGGQSLLDSICALVVRIGGEVTLILGLGVRYLAVAFPRQRQVLLGLRLILIFRLL